MPAIMRAVESAKKAIGDGTNGLHEIYYNFMFDPRYDPRKELQRCARSEECGSGYICNGGQCKFVGGDENPGGDGCRQKRDKFFDIPDRPPTPTCSKSNPQKKAKARSCGNTAPGVVPAGKSCVPITFPVPEKPWCGTKCCSCGTSGCGCFEGDCPPPGQRCTRFCDEAGKSGSNVRRCGFKKCPACQYCKMVEDPDPFKFGEVPRCVAQTYTGADCRCGYQCPGCMQCSFSGNCLIKNCPPSPPEPEPPGTTCEPECYDSEICVTNTVLGTVTCNTVTQCGDIPDECEPCDCNCDGECPDCQFCNSAGKCEEDPKCDECIPDTRTFTKVNGVYSYTTYNSICQLGTRVEGGGEVTTTEVTTDCGPLTLVILSEPQAHWERTYTAECPDILTEELTATPGTFEVRDRNGPRLTGTFSFPTPGGRITATSVFPDVISLE